jgi:hypothetical protein
MFFRNLFARLGQKSTRRVPYRRTPTRLGVEALEDRMLLSLAFFVTNTNDSGAGSLRDAILASNANNIYTNPYLPPGPNYIVFNIGKGAQTINLQSPLPAITYQAELLGNTQPGYAGKPLVEIKGPLTGYGTGLEVQANGCVIQGLAIGDFDRGIELQSSGNTVLGDYVGVDLSGSRAIPNQVGIFDRGGNQIGGTQSGQGNVISGNLEDGMQLCGAGDTVQGNLVGTDATGTRPLGNGTAGIACYGATDTTIGGQSQVRGGRLTGAGNVISANGGNPNVDGDPHYSGISLFFGSDNNVVQGNFIGTDISGTHALGNIGEGSYGGDGVYLKSSSYNLIGGPGRGNVIAANNANGVEIDGDQWGNSIQNQVQGNWIGTDQSGKLHLGNHQNGVYLYSDPSATAASYGNQIGGEDGGDPVPAGVGNTIAFNTLDGVFVNGQMMVSNPIRGNSIYGNGKMAIDTQDVPPVTVQLFGANSATHVVQGAVFSPDPYVFYGTFIVDFYASSPSDGPAGQLQGRHYLGSEVVFVPPSYSNVPGSPVISFTFTGTFTKGEVISATITEYSDSVTSGFETSVVAV